MNKNSRKASKKRWLPSAETIRNHKSLRFLGQRIHHPNLWHMTRYSISVGVFIGLFMCFMPIPIQMVVAAIFAIMLRANLWCSVGLVWVSNPITMGPMMIFAYKLGRYVLGIEGLKNGQLTIQKLLHDFAHIWKPLLTGCFISGIVLGLVGFLFVQLFWQFIYRKFYHTPPGNK